MKLYPVHITFRIHSKEILSDDQTSFDKVIPIPFVPYLAEGKKGHIYFCDCNGRERSIPIIWEKVSWTCGKSKAGFWSMWINLHPPRFCGKAYVEILSTDVRYKER